MSVAGNFFIRECNSALLIIKEFQQLSKPTSFVYVVKWFNKKTRAHFITTLSKLPSKSKLQNSSNP